MKKKFNIKIRYLALAVLMTGTMCGVKTNVNAVECPDVRIVFARGSGGERWVDQNYLEFKNTIETKLMTVPLSYEFVDLDYEAVGVGLDKLDVSLGAFFGAGEAYEFGDSVKSGVKNLDKMVSFSGCPDTKYVIGGYSQGAMVVSKALQGLNPDKLIYAATFGDPKVYLPEGKGIIPPACKGENLSDYRMYVPDCQAYMGLLGAYNPYEPEMLVGKVGTWCNKRDIFCSSHLNISDHTAYIADDLYEDASRVVFDKICKYFDLKNKISSPHDTAILIDSSGSMSNMIQKYKNEALRLARETFKSGGRVALYDYRDLEDPYTPVKHCDFDSCTISVLKSELRKIKADGGGDTSESLLSASFHAMTELNWKYGSTKSLVVLTDANFLSPDRDGATFDEVVKLSKKIDPVNFYIITDSEYEDDYADLARMTGGRVVTNLNELDLLTNYIMERYDSLPRVEEADETELVSNLPVLNVEKAEKVGNELVAEFTTTGSRVLVTLDDAVLGVMEVRNGKGTVTVGELDDSKENNLKLIPLGSDVRGEASNVTLNKARSNTDGSGDKNLGEVTFEVVDLKAPKTGRL